MKTTEAELAEVRELAELTRTFNEQNRIAGTMLSILADITELRECLRLALEVIDEREPDALEIAARCDLALAEPGTVGP